jgi:hypothetical protein
MWRRLDGLFGGGGAMAVVSGSSNSQGNVMTTEERVCSSVLFGLYSLLMVASLV